MEAAGSIARSGAKDVHRMLLVPPAWRPLELCSQCFFPINGQPSRLDRRQDELSDLVRRETVDTLRAFELHRKRIAEKHGVIGVERHRNTSIEVLTQRMRFDRRLNIVSTSANQPGIAS